jgi:hypothetical protein
VAALEELGACTTVACGHLHTAVLLSPVTNQPVPPSPIAEARPAAATRGAVAGGEGGEGGEAGGEAGGESGEGGGEGGEGGGEGGEGGGEGGEGGGEGGEGGGEAAPLLYGFGHAEFAQLGTGDMGSGGEAARAFSLPQHVPLRTARGSRLLRAVACGALHTCVLCDDGASCTRTPHPAPRTPHQAAYP